MAKLLPTYPVYIPSRGRAKINLTAQCLVKDEVPFALVVAPKELAAYEAEFPGKVVALPSDDMDIVGVRNWIRDRSQAAGDVRHWQLDDNIKHFGRRWKAQRLYCDAGLALHIMESFVDRYENVALAGPNYWSMCPDEQWHPVFLRNAHVYSCTLVLNSIPYRWRGPYNDDTDLCLQVLSGGWCTVQFNAFLINKMRTMTMKGGMTDSNKNSYQGDGRLKMARTLERRWPGVVTTRRRFGRAQHVVFDAWKRFDTPLKLKEGVVRGEGNDEWGMELRVQGDGPQTPLMKELHEEYGRKQ